MSAAGHGGGEDGCESGRVSNGAAPTLEMFVRQCAKALAGSSTPILDARVLVGHVLGLDAAGLIAQGRALLSADDRAAIEALVARRAAGEPIAYLTGEKEFRSLSFLTAPGVLTPRPDSETLIDVIEAARPQDAPLRILDLGLGTGCLLISLLCHFHRAVGVGVDRNQAAAALAAQNAARLGVEDRMSALVGDWFAPIAGQFDVIVSNPPYIRDEDYPGLPAEVRDFEDRGALTAGADGLRDYRTILAAAPAYLAPDGLLVFELGAGQAGAVAALAARSFPEAEIACAADLSGIERALSVERRIG